MPLFASNPLVANQDEVRCDEKEEGVGDGRLRDRHLEAGSAELKSAAAYHPNLNPQRGHLLTSLN